MGQDQVHEPSRSPQGSTVQLIIHAPIKGPRPLDGYDGSKRKCPDLIFVKPRFDAYKAISLQIREIFAEYTRRRRAGALPPRRVLGCASLGNFPI